MCTEMSVTASGLLGLVPDIVCEETTVDVAKAAAMYVNDLPHPELLETDDSQRRSKAVLQGGLPKCARLAAHCLHYACDIVRV